MTLCFCAGLAPTKVPDEDSRCLSLFINNRTLSWKSKSLPHRGNDVLVQQLPLDSDTTPWPALANMSSLERTWFLGAVYVENVLVRDEVLLQFHGDSWVMVLFREGVQLRKWIINYSVVRKQYPDTNIEGLTSYALQRIFNRFLIPLQNAME
jgi:hypothetical protein